MGRKRRQVRLEDSSAWVFNRMVEAYQARPPYPVPLIDALLALVEPIGKRVLDLGAGIGHVALPLARRGLSVTAVEPALAMLDRLQCAAAAQELELCAVHASAEALPFRAPCFELAVIADALHFIDAELAAAELRRVLVRGGVLAIVTCEYTETPFMCAVRDIVDEISDRRPRRNAQAIRHLTSLAQTRLSQSKQFVHATPVDLTTLERILQSVSFVGPAFDSNRFSRLREALRDLPHQPVWSRTFTLHCARRR